MSFPQVTPEAWRAAVERDLAGKPFAKALVHQTLEGVAIQPLYTEAPAVPRVLGEGAPFRIAMRHGADATEAEIQDDLEGGADALWLPASAVAKVPARRDPHVLLVVDEDDERAARLNDEPAWRVSTLDAHLRGADAVDDVAIALATIVDRLAGAARPLLVRVGVGRDTFVELAKVRALRLAIRKVLAALGHPARFVIHAVSSPRTMTTRDPWVNMLRVTTELFAAVLGGADLVTPLPFDDALATPSALGRRLARNTGHVLREESGLGRVIDPGAGSYYLDTLTDRLARAAWDRFRDIEREGGLAKARATIDARIAQTRAARRAAIASRKLPLLGVSEFAHLGETRTSAARLDEASELRDGAAFEALRSRAERAPVEVVLAPLGPFAESRARVGFATAFFAAGGLRARELEEGEAAPAGSIACVCGSDERYAAEAAARARSLRENGCRHVLLAGRPGALEADLRAAGVDGFLFLGADVVATLDPLLGGAA